MSGARPGEDGGPPPTPDGGRGPDSGKGLCTPLELGSDTGDAVAAGRSTASSPARFTGSCGGAGPEELFRWIAPEDGTYVFDTLGSDYDTVLYLWDATDSCQSLERPGACNDDAAGELDPTSRVQQFVREGQALIIVVDAFGDGGRYQLNIHADASEDCDNGLDDNANGLADCADPACTFSPECRGGMECDAKRISGLGDNLVLGSTRGLANLHAGSCGGSQAPDDLLLWTAPFDGTFTILTRGSAFDTVLYAVEVGPMCSAAEIDGACNDDVEGMLFSAIRVTLRAEDTLGIVVDGWSREAGDYALSIYAEDVAPEDCDNDADDNGNGLFDCDDPACSTSDVCSGGARCPDTTVGRFLGSINGGTRDNENRLASACGGEQAPEHTFLWTAPFDGTFRFDTHGSGYDTVLALYPDSETCSGAPTDALICNDDAVNLTSEVAWQAQEGESFLIAVDGWTDHRGPFTLSIRPENSPAVEVACEDGEDNDADGAIDCMDSDCTFAQECAHDVEVECDNGIDDDGDGLTDCDDDDCSLAPACGVMDEADCDDGTDNDGDGLTDCDDTDCSGDPTCLPSVELDCEDGIDNDGDGFTDCSDGDCSSADACRPSRENDCDDGMDNDGDGATDCGDLDCRGAPGCLPARETLCDDGTDDDLDGATDCADPDCRADPACRPATETQCDNGIDEDGDGALDCEDSDCDDADACQPPPACHDDDLGEATGRRVSRGNTQGAVNDASGSCGGGAAPDRILRWTAPADGTYRFDTFGSTYDTVLYLWEATESCEPRQLVCNDDALQGLQSMVTAGLAAGESVFVVVDGWNFSSGNYNLNITQVGDDPNPMNEVDCFNGLDDDNDGLVDCADDDCTMDCTFP